MLKKNLEIHLKEKKDLKEKYLQEGPLVYELFAILIHYGGAYGGHYYTYIQSFEDKKWYNFNDSRVSEIDVNSIPEKVFGGENSSNAYMLMYKQVIYFFYILF